MVSRVTPGRLTKSRLPQGPAAGLSGGIGSERIEARERTIYSLSLRKYFHEWRKFPLSAPLVAAGQVTSEKLP